MSITPSIIPQSWDVEEVRVHVQNVLNSEPTCQSKITLIQAIPNIVFNNAVNSSTVLLSFCCDRPVTCEECVTLNNTAHE